MTPNAGRFGSASIGTLPPPWYSVGMEREADLVRQVRLATGLSTLEMADLVGLDEAEVEALEQGRTEPSTLLLDRYARVFGRTLSSFLEGGASGAPAMVLFRSLRAEGPSFEDLVATGGAPTLGEFLRCVADVAELEALLGAQENKLADTIGRLPRVGPGTPFEQGEDLARAARNALGLGSAPVPSMVGLFHDLGITLAWTDPDELDQDIDAASVRTPRPATLVNLGAGGAEPWWRTRMTLAHELCHVLFDFGEGAGTAFLFSPRPRAVAHGSASLGRPRRALRLPQDLEQMERRANAFAAHFLAPAEGVRETVGALPSTSDQAINAVCQRFQIGRITTVNQLTSTYRLSTEERRAMLDRRPSENLPKHHPDAAARPGIRAGRLQDLVIQALSAGRIGGVRARRYLGLALSDPLPSDPALSEAARAPIHTPEHRALLAAQRYLTERAEYAGCFAGAVTPERDGYRVSLEVPAEVSASRQAARSLRVSAAFEVSPSDAVVAAPPR